MGTKLVGALANRNEIGFRNLTWETRFGPRWTAIRLFSQGFPAISNPANSPRRERYYYLDAMRGIAAIYVLVYHIGTRVGGTQFVPNGSVALDFFFMLSGMVIAASYEEKIGKSMSIGAFARNRLRRFIPLTTLGLALGTVYLLLRWYLTPEKSDPLASLLSASFLNLLLVPKFWWSPATHFETFPANGAIWSLSFEFLINILWAALLVRRSTPILVAAVLAGASLVLVSAINAGTVDVGWNGQTYFGGCGRTIFGFTLGALIYRFRRVFPTSMMLAPMWSFLMLSVFIVAPVHSLYWELLAVFIGMPLAVIFGLVTGSRSIMPGEELLGRVSFPLYALHVPLLMFASGLQKKLYPDLAIGAYGLLIVPPVLLVAFLTLKYYDEPIQARLSRLDRLRRERRAMPVLA